MRTAIEPERKENFKTVIEEALSGHNEAFLFFPQGIISS